MATSLLDIRVSVDKNQGVLMSLSWAQYPSIILHQLVIHMVVLKVPSGIETMLSAACEQGFGHIISNSVH